MALSRSPRPGHSAPGDARDPGAGHRRGGVATDVGRLRVAFLGNDPWSVPSLEVIAESEHELVLVVTRTPRPRRRSGALDPTPVAEISTRLGLPLVETDTILAGDALEELSEAHPDVLVVVAYGEILTRELLDLAPKGAINLHFSLLPAYRGASPVQHALLDGLDRTGVVTMLLDQGMDTGAILMEKEVPIDPADDAASLGARLADEGAGLLGETLHRMWEGTLATRAQNEEEASVASKLDAADRRIDWSVPAADVVNQVRAFAPDPGAVTLYRGENLKILRAEVAKETGDAGTVLMADGRGLLVAAGKGAVRVLEVAPAGRKRMEASAFALGSRPKLGERLG